MRSSRILPALLTTGRRAIATAPTPAPPRAVRSIRFQITTDKVTIIIIIVFIKTDLQRGSSRMREHTRNGDMSPHIKRPAAAAVGAGGAVPIAQTNKLLWREIIQRGELKKRHVTTPIEVCTHYKSANEHITATIRTSDVTDRG